MASKYFTQDLVAALRSLRWAFSSCSQSKLFFFFFGGNLFERILHALHGPLSACFLTAKGSRPVELRSLLLQTRITLHARQGTDCFKHGYPLLHPFLPRPVWLRCGRTVTGSIKISSSSRKSSSLACLFREIQSTKQQDLVLHDAEGSEKDDAVYAKTWPERDRAIEEICWKRWSFPRS